MKFRYYLFMLLLIFGGSLLGQNFPGKQWEYPDTNEKWDESGLEAFRKYVIDSTKITGMVIVEQGAIVFKYGDIKENSYIASCRKSVLAMLYGKHVEKGTIDLNKSIAELGIDDVDGILPIEQGATIEDIISARSGIYHKEGYPGGMQQYAPERGSVEPGTYWLYSNWDFNVAGHIFEQETGRNIYDEVEAQLAHPLKMEDWDRSLQKKQGNRNISKYLAYPMWFSTRDMARIGLLMLNQGNWDGQQLISEQWVQEMLEEQTSYKEVNANVPSFRNSGVNLGYSYMWWLLQDMNDPRFEGAYSARGAMGQNITVYPAIDVVMAFKTKSDYRRRNSRKTRLDILQKVPILYKGAIQTQ